ncbi:Squalene synthetase [Hordeum vulgare]|nr:Squalene synthetase [Hordeum vulgare]
MGLLSRPEEVAALVRLKVAAGPIRRQIPPKMHSAFAYEMLQRVSCSFALRPELRNAHAVEVVQDKLYVVGGSRNECFLSDVQRPVPTIREGVNFDLPDVVAAAPPIAGEGPCLCDCLGLGLVHLGLGLVMCWISTVGAGAGLDQLRLGEVTAVPERQEEGLGADVPFYCADVPLFYYMCTLASNACFGPETYKIVASGVDELSKLVWKWRLSGVLPDPDPPARADVEVVGSSNVKNPPKSAKKGRPKDKEKRRKPLVELRQEKAQQKGKKKGE